MNSLGFGNLNVWLVETNRRIKDIYEIVHNFSNKDIFSFNLNDAIFFRHCNKVLIHKIKTDKLFNGVISLIIKIDDKEHEIYNFICNQEFIDIEINKYVNNVRNKEIRVLLRDNKNEIIKADNGYVYIKS